MESYHPYLTPQKVSKNPHTYCFHNTLPKSAKSHFICLCPLGVNVTFEKYPLISWGMLSATINAAKSAKSCPKLPKSAQR
jgi:hypothetical protein